MWSHRLKSSINGLAFSPDGRTLYTADNSCHVYAWDTVSRKRRVVLKHNFISGEVPNGMACIGRFLVFLDTAPPQVWDLGTDEAKLLKIPKKFSNRSTKFDATRGRLLALGSGGKSVVTWDIAQRNAGPVLASWARAVRPMYGNRFLLSGDGLTLGIESRRGPLIFRDVASSTEIGQMEPFRGYMGYTRMSPDGRSMFGISVGWKLWDVPTGMVRCEFDHQPLAFHPTAPVCAVSSPGGLTLFNTQTGEPIRTLDFDLGTETRYACFSPDGLTCAAAGGNKRFAVFDVDV